MALKVWTVSMCLLLLGTLKISDRFPFPYGGNSRPDLIDSALLRPGRLDKSLFCSMPNVEERKDVGVLACFYFFSVSNFTLHTIDLDSSWTESFNSLIRAVR
jgi:hypothetical protein